PGPTPPPTPAARCDGTRPWATTVPGPPRDRWTARCPAWLVPLPPRPGPLQGTPARTDGDCPGRRRRSGAGRCGRAGQAPAAGPAAAAHASIRRAMATSRRVTPPASWLVSVTETVG